MPRYNVTLPDGSETYIEAPNPEDAARRAARSTIIRRPQVAGEPLPSLETTTPPPELTTGQRIVRGGALSMAGGVIGGAAGTALAPYTLGVINPITGAAAGAGIGEAVTQFADPLKSGVKDPSLLQVGASLAAPVAAPIARRVFLALPGTAAGLHQYAIKKFGQRTGDLLVSKFAPIPGTSSRLFEQAGRMATTGGQTYVVPTELEKATQKVEVELAKSHYPTKGAKSLVTSTRKMIGGGAAPVGSVGPPTLPNRPVPFDEFRINQVDLGAVVRNLESTSGPALGRAKLLYKAMWEDIERSASSTSQVLKEAVDMFKREEAGKFLKDGMLKAWSHRGGIPQYNFDSVLTYIDRNRDTLSRLLPAKEIDEISNLIRPYTKYPPIAAAGRMGIESTPFSQRVLIGSAIGATAEMVGAGTGNVGSSAIYGILGIEVMATALTTAAGRKFIELLAAQGVPIDRMATILLQAGRVALPPPDEKGKKAATTAEGKPIITGGESE